MVLMLRPAFDATQNSRYFRVHRKAIDWFLGENDLHIPLYDFRTKGCCDALIPGGVNSNQGAESTLSFLLSLLAVVESYTIADKIEGGKGVSRRQAKLIEQTTQKPAPIKSIPVKAKPKKRQVEELA